MGQQTPYDLEELRISIDRLDNVICAVLAERFSLTEKVGLYKASKGIDPIDKDREKQQFAKVSVLATQYGLDPQFAQKVLRLIIDEVVVHHKALQHQAHEPVNK